MNLGESPYLHPLDLPKRLRKLTLRILQTVHAMRQQEVHRRVQRIPVQQRRHIHLLALAPQHPNQLLRLSFEQLQIRDPILHKLRPDQLPATMPQIPIRREDTVPQEILPVLVEGFPLPIIPKLRREDRFDVLRLRSENETLPA